MGELKLVSGHVVTTGGIELIVSVQAAASQGLLRHTEQTAVSLEWGKSVFVYRVQSERYVIVSIS